MSARFLFKVGSTWGATRPASGQAQMQNKQLFLKKKRKSCLIIILFSISISTCPDAGRVAPQELVAPQE